MGGYEMYNKKINRKGEADSAFSHHTQLYAQQKEETQNTN